MRALKLKLYQEVSCYRKPLTFKNYETYPLPPYSTLNGLLHRVLDAREYTRMRISVQGGSESKFKNYQTMHSYKSGNKEDTTMPYSHNLLYGVNLIVHIVADNDILDTLYNNLKSNVEYLSLGRAEDLLRIDDAYFTELQKSDDEITLISPAYIPLDHFKSPDHYRQMNYIGYKLSTHYTNNAVSTGKREMNTIDVAYIQRGGVISNDILKNVWIDEDGYAVFLNLQ